jgi:hypothetical protein
MIARDAPAQVNNRGRRRDGDLVLTIVRLAFDRAVEGRLNGFPAAISSMSDQPADLGFSLSPTPSVRFGTSSQGLFLGVLPCAAAPFFFVVYAKRLVRRRSRGSGRVSYRPQDHKRRG